jgi:DNA (cytosine-5)-methyltransferase 1
MKDANWDVLAANDLKAEVKRAGLTYAQLAALLTATDEPISAQGINKKLNRGAFSHAFFLRCVSLMERHARVQGVPP